MSQPPEAANTNEGIIKVGSTGTIGSLMIQELESLKRTSQASASSPKKPQTVPVSVLCGAALKKPQQRLNQPTSHHCSTVDTGVRSSKDAQKLRRDLQRNKHRIPMLSSDNITVDGEASSGKLEKKGHAYIVEVVDLNCSSNPMSSQRKKIGFYKLSESIA